MNQKNKFDTADILICTKCDLPMVITCNLCKGDKQAMLRCSCVANSYCCDGNCNLDALKNIKLNIDRSDGTKVIIEIPKSINSFTLNIHFSIND